MRRPSGDIVGDTSIARIVGEARQAPRRELHDEDVGIAGALHRHQDARAVRREARRERHAAKRAELFLLAGLDVEEINLARLVVEEGHVGDLLLRRREARRQRLVVEAVGQEHRAGAVLIHDHQALVAFFLRTRLVNVDDAGVEIALLAGQRFVDEIGDLVRGAAPVVGRRLEGDGAELFVRVDVPNSALRLRFARPAICRTSPTTRTCALMMRQSGNRGRTSTLPRSST